MQSGIWVYPIEASGLPDSLHPTLPTCTKPWLLPGHALLMCPPGLQEVGWFDKVENSSGAIAGRLSTDTLYIRGAVGDQMGVIVQSLVTIIGAYVIAFTAGWRMTLVITAAVPLLGAGAWINTKFEMGFADKVHTLTACCMQLVTALTCDWSQH